MSQFLCRITNNSGQIRDIYVPKFGTTIGPAARGVGVKNCNANSAKFFGFDVDKKS